MDSRPQGCGARAYHVESSWIRDWTHVPCTGRQVLNHWTTREVPDQQVSLITECHKGLLYYGQTRLHHSHKLLVAWESCKPARRNSAPIFRTESSPMVCSLLFQPTPWNQPIQGKEQDRLLPNHTVQTSPVSFNWASLPSIFQLRIQGTSFLNYLKFRETLLVWSLYTT